MQPLGNNARAPTLMALVGIINDLPECVSIINLVGVGIKNLIRSKFVRWTYAICLRNAKNNFGLLSKFKG